VIFADYVEAFDRVLRRKLRDIMIEKRYTST
jgi:hypothetical protein